VRLLVRFIGLVTAAIGLICVTIGFTMSPQYVIAFPNVPYRDVLLQAGYALSPAGVALLVLSFAMPGAQDNRRGGPPGPQVGRSSRRPGEALRRGRRFVIAGWLICGLDVGYALLLGWGEPSPGHGFVSPEILVAFVVLVCGSAVLVSGAAVLAYGLLLTADGARSRRDVVLLISSLGAAALLLAWWLL
jgi:hypothetical protein